MNHYKLLIVDRKKLQREGLKQAIGGGDYMYYEAEDKERACNILKDYKVDLILVDLNKDDNFSTIEDLRKETLAPLIVLSDCSKIRTKVTALSKNIDDYIEKPYHPEELRGRLGAHLSRYIALKGPEEGARKIKVDHWTLDRDCMQIYDNDNNAGDLTLQEYYLLEALALSAQKVLSRSELVQCVKKNGQAPVSDRAIDVQITRIRKKLGDVCRRTGLIKTVRGAGYMLNRKPEIIS